MYTICISPQTDNHANTSSHNFHGLDAVPDTQPKAPENTQTWLERSDQLAADWSWTVTDLTPPRTMFLATSTPSPPMPDTRTLDNAIFFMAACPNTYLPRTHKESSKNNQHVNLSTALQPNLNVIRITIIYHVHLEPQHRYIAVVSSKRSFYSNVNNEHLAYQLDFSM